MKAISITGSIIAILSFIAAMYLQFIVVPAYDSLEASINTGFADELTSLMLMAAHDTKVNLGMGLVLSSGLALLLCGLGAFKTKSKLAYAGTLLSVIALLIGLMHGTHMFS